MSGEVLQPPPDTPDFRSPRMALNGSELPFSQVEDSQRGVTHRHGNRPNGCSSLRMLAAGIFDRLPLATHARELVLRRASYGMSARVTNAGSHGLSRLVDMVAEERAHGHAFLALPVLTGFGAALWFVLPVTPAPTLIAVLFLLGLGVVFLLRGHHGRLRLVPLVAVILLAGMLLAVFEDWRHSTVVLDQPVTTIVTGVVEMREPSGEGRWRYVLALESTASPKLRRPPERITVISRTRQPPFDIGERMTGRARISPPSGPALPGLADFAFSAYFDGIGAIGFFYGQPTRADGSVVASWGQSFERTVFAWRSAIASRIRATVPGDPGAFAAAIVTDERRAISDETTEALRVSGLAHIVAISGLNMALAAAIFFVGMRSLLALLPGFAQRFPVKKLAAGAALAMATGYYLISGFGVSAERAYIMMAIMLVAVFFDRAAISLRNVALAALVVLVMSPSEILGPSFQMSFAATVALVAGYSAWSRRRDEGEDAPWRQVLPKRSALKPIVALAHLIGGVFATSLIGGLSTAIFSIEHFHRMSTYGLAANLAAMPLVSFIVMPFGLIGMLLMPFGLDGFFLQIMGRGLEGVIVVAKTVAAWGGDVNIGRQPPLFLPLATAALLLLTLLRTRLHLLGLPLLALAVFLSWRAGQARPPDFLMSEDGSLAALLAGDDVATNRTRPPDFIYGQWRHALSLSVPTAPTLLDMPKNKPPPVQEPFVSLTKDASEKAVVVGALPVSPVATAMAETRGTPGRGDAGENGRAKSRSPPLTPDDIEQARQAMRQALGDGDAGTFTCAARSWCVAGTQSGPTIAVVEDARFAGAACDVVQLVVSARARFDHCRSGAVMVNGEALRRTGALEIRFNGTSDPAGWSIAAAMAATDRSWTRHRQYDWRRNLFDGHSLAPLHFLSGASKLNDSGG